MDSPDSPHPNEEALRAYGPGRLGDSPAVAVDRHLETSDQCRRRLDERPGESSSGRSRDASGRPGGDRRPHPSPAARADSSPLDLVGLPHYEVVRELGRGGMGVVYLARNSLLGRLEVLKVVGERVVERPGVRDRFLREIQSAARLRHRNIVAAYSAFRLGEGIALAMEYVEGRDLADLVEAKGPLAMGLACSFISQAALGLQHAHEQGMVHRDIKPSNLILAREGKRAVVKVLDFGLAKVDREGQSDRALTREGQMLGTPDYIAPEQIRDPQKADIRADIYSLGCTLHYLLTGSPPFRGASLYALLQAHFLIEPSPLNLIRPEVPEGLATLVAKMMAKDPRRRFQTPVEVARALAPYFEPDAAPLAGTLSGRPGAGPAGQETGKGVASTPSADLEASWQPGGREPSRTSREREVLATQAEPGEVVGWTAKGPHVAGPARRRTTWRPSSLAVALLLLPVLAWALVFRVGTGRGDLVFSDLPEHAVVTVDGKVCTVEFPGGTGPATITVPAGDHRVKVAWNGVEVHGQEVKIAAGDKKWIEVRLERPPAPRPARDGANGDNVSSTTSGPSFRLRPLETREMASLLDIPLANGGLWKGWKRDPRNWNVKDGMLHFVPGGDNAGIRSDRRYADFELRFRLRHPYSSNTGIEFRGNFECEVLGDRTGSLYCSGYLKRAPSDQISKVLKTDDFNEYVIRCVGKHVTIKVNGTTAVDDDFPAIPDEGTIAFLGQLDIGDPVYLGPMDVADVEIRELEGRKSTGESPPMFNGKDLGGWSAYSGSRKVDAREVARVVGGEVVLIASGAEARLRTERAYRRFSLSLEYLLPVGGSLSDTRGGILVMPESGGGADYRGALECAVKPGDSGTLLAFEGLNLAGQKPLGLVGKATRKIDAERPPGEWNRMVLRCDSSHVSCDLNGREVNWGEASRPVSGWICLWKQGAEVRFRNIEIAPSPPAEDSRGGGQAEAMPRRVWHGSHSRFENIADGRWKEINNDDAQASFHFEELARTKGYVELVDRGRGRDGIWVRLEAERASIIHTGRDLAWRVLEPGRWAQPGGSTIGRSD